MEFYVFKDCNLANLSDNITMNLFAQFNNTSRLEIKNYSLVHKCRGPKSPNINTRYKDIENN